MKKTTFEMLLIGLSAPMAGIGMGMLTNGSIGGAFMLLGASMKLVVAYFRTPKDLLIGITSAEHLKISKIGWKKFKMN